MHEEKRAVGVDKSMVPLSWRTVAVTSLILAVGCLAALVIIGRGVAADALATTALVLAVVSLVSQVFIALVNFYNTTRQAEQFTRLTEEMKSSLSEVRVLAADIADAQSGQIAETMRFFMSRESGEYVDVQDPPTPQSEHDIKMAALESMLQESSSGPLARRLESKNDVFEALTAHLMRAGLVPRIRGHQDLEWEDTNGAENRAEVKGRDAVTSRTAFLRAIRSAGGQGDLAGLFGDKEQKPEYVPVLALPAEPEFPEWRRIAEDAGVKVVWPDVFHEDIRGQ